MNLFDYKIKKIFQGVAFRTKMISYWFFHPLMFNIRLMAIHSYVDHMLHFSNILFLESCTFDNTDALDVLQFTVALT